MNKEEKQAMAIVLNLLIAVTDKLKATDEAFDDVLHAASLLGITDFDLAESLRQSTQRRQADKKLYGMIRRVLKRSGNDDFAADERGPEPMLDKP